MAGARPSAMRVGMKDRSRPVAAAGASRWSVWVNAAPDAALAAVYVYAWRSPSSFGLAHTRGLILLMAMEFIVVHASPFLGRVVLSERPRGQRLLYVLALAALYSVFVGGFALAFKTWWPLGSFWGLVCNRLLILLPGQAPAGGELDLLQRGWAAAIGFFTLALFLSLIPFPPLGVTHAVRAALHLPGGVWGECPQNALAAGAAYFGLTALSELFQHRWIQPVAR